MTSPQTNRWCDYLNQPAPTIAIRITQLINNKSFYKHKIKLRSVRN